MDNLSWAPAGAPAVPRRRLLGGPVDTGLRAVRPAGWRRLSQDLRQEAGAEEVAALAQQRMLRWCVIAGLTWRALAYPPAFFQAVREGEQLPLSLLVAIGLVLVGNLGLLAAVLRRGPLRLLQSNGFFAVDLAVVAGLNLWTSAAILHGILYGSYQDAFLVYAWDTVVLWTAIRGTATGLLICMGVAGPLQWGMASLNGFTLTTIPWGGLVERDLWVLAHFAIAAIVTLVAREIAWTTAAAGLRAGQVASSGLLRSSARWWDGGLWWAHPDAARPAACAGLPDETGGTSQLGE